MRGKWTAVQWARWHDNNKKWWKREESKRIVALLEDSRLQSGAQSSKDPKDSRDPESWICLQSAFRNEKCFLKKNIFLF